MDKETGISSIAEKLENYYKKEHHFNKSITKLRGLAKKAGAEESFKWSSPVYTIDGKNVFWIAKFKNHFSLGFFNGAFLKDSAKVLENAQEGKTKAMRHWKFKTIEEIDEPTALKYMQEAIANEKKGLSIKPQKKKSIKIPEILKEALTRNHALKKAFSKLTEGKKQEYYEYLTSPKLESTKQRRLKRIIPKIAAGKSLHDQYRRK